MYIQASVGIYIESDHVSLACLKRSFKGLCLAAHAIYPLAKGNPEENTEEIRKHVNEFLREHRMASADIFLGIQRDLTILKYIELPAAVKENLKGTLTYEMEKYVPLPAGDIYFDCQIVAEDKDTNKLKVLLIAVKKELIDPYLDPEKKLGAGISGIEINSTALVNYFAYKPNTQNADAYAILYLGDQHLELSLVKKRLLHYSRHVKIDKRVSGLEHLVQEELGLLRKSPGLEQGLLEVALCGPDSGSVVEMLKAREDIGLRPVEISGTGIPSDVLAPAYGLALKGIQKTPMDINLLPVGLRKKVSKIGYYTMSVLAGLFILSILVWGGSNLLHQKRVSGKLAGEIKQLSTEVAGIHKMQAQSTALGNMIDAINVHRRRHIPVLGIMLDLTKGIPEGAWLDRLTVTDKGGEIEGYAPSASALIPLLAASPLLKDVAFLSPITKGKDGKERFRIGFKVR
ncbi:MAG: pilus assembly protein PilM [Deltaproteobacteria bacterium]|nr:pilus assembly protein PilM [Deltaproteobacteria bacterium]